MKILITGIAGSGKTTISAKLNRLGYYSTDLDRNGICAWINKKTGLQTEYIEGAGPRWIEEHRWQVIIPRLIDLLSSVSHDNIFVTGKIARFQLKEVSKMFDIIFLLKPDDLVIDSRLAKRNSNHKNFAKTKSERKVIIDNRIEFEKECIDAGAVVLSNNADLKQIIKDIK